MSAFRVIRAIALGVVIISLMMYASRTTSIVGIGIGVGVAFLVATTLQIEGDLRDRLKDKKSDAET